MSMLEAKKAADALVAAAVIPEERELAEALVEITKKYGKFNSDDTGVWAGYTPAAENDKADIGVKCGNCILYAGGTTCTIVEAEVEPDGYCRFALIPDGVVTAAGSKSPCWDGYKQVGMKKGKNGNMVPNCVPVNASNDSNSDTEFASDCPMCADGCMCMASQCSCPPTCGCGCNDTIVILSAASKPAPKKDRIRGSKKNKPGSAAGGKTIVFSKRVETALQNKVKEHNEKATAGRRVSLSMLKAVYRRGAGAYSSSHRPGKTRDQWAMARVNAFLRLVRSGKPANPNYKQDNDLLPKEHPRSSKEASITAGALARDEITIFLKNEDEYETPEHALVAFAEYSGLGYEVIPAFRAAWIRGVENEEEPFNRAKELAINLYSSRDADLLPK